MELRLGRLREAERTFSQALELAEANASAGSSVMRGTADMLVGLSRMAWYRNDLPAVAEYLRRSDELGEGASLAQNPYRWRVGMARLERPRVTSRLRWSFSTKQSGCTWATTHRTCNRSTRPEPACSPLAATSPRHAPGHASTKYHRRRAVLSARVRAHHARPSPARGERRYGSSADAAGRCRTPGSSGGRGRGR